MINFTEGQISLGAKGIFVLSDYEDLDALANEGLIEKRKDPDGSGDYFYAEAVADDIRFGVFINLREKKIDYISLRWLDSPMKGWDDVSEKALKDECRLLLNVVQKTVETPPDNKKIGNALGISNGGMLT